MLLGGAPLSLSLVLGATPLADGRVEAPPPPPLPPAPPVMDERALLGGSILLNEGLETGAGWVPEDDVREEGPKPVEDVDDWRGGGGGRPVRPLAVLGYAAGGTAAGKVADGGGTPLDENVGGGGTPLEDV